MTGLLRSLGAQALGLPPAMRPAARLRAGAAPIRSDLAQVYESFSTPESPSAADASVDRSVDHAAPAPPSVPPAAIGLPVSDREDAPVIGRVDRPVATTAAEDHRGVREPPPIAAVAEPATWAASDVPARRIAASIAAHDIEPIKGSEVIARPAPGPAPGPARRRNDPARFEVSVRDRDASLREQPAPDVHIHIGRVELTAVTAPAAARRMSAPQARKPMSLDEYLQQRRRKTP